MLDELDQSVLNFKGDSLFLMNVSLAIIMFGVALDIRREDFFYLAKAPKPFLLGVIAQFIMLPFLTFVLVWFIQPIPSVAMGMFLVAVCPGGNISNFLTNLAKGNTALSVSLTAFATAFSIVLTPFNFGFWASLYEPTDTLLKEISLSYWDVFQTIALILGIPLVLGMYVGHRFPGFSMRASRLLKPISIGIFGAIVLVAFYSNYNLFLQFILLIFGWVLAHNGAALLAGFSLAKLFRLSLEDTKTLTIETGIQNSGLALILIFGYFDGLGGMAIIAGWWGIWHILSGLSVAALWKPKKIT
ncbi:Na(+) dependent transporter,Sodium Bile acid symporter family [Lunatimonas lonarensis]|uniref:Na(+) dependent transporter,Sodium Bile acid symporter family n=1 Tax=Lunatimonas lonarensis TaxID=1232681 RepID=R7ZRE5_9BACT|nr:Na(+) dependent transporter,Sodium Bile acid symporter family [Lunatimonas lonarensis]